MRYGVSLGTVFDGISEWKTDRKNIVWLFEFDVINFAQVSIAD